MYTGTLTYVYIFYLTFFYCQICLLGVFTHALPPLAQRIPQHFRQRQHVPHHDVKIKRHLIHKIHHTWFPAKKKNNATTKTRTQQEHKKNTKQQQNNKTTQPSAPTHNKQKHPQPSMYNVPFGIKFNSFQIQNAFHPCINDDQDKQTIVLRPGHFFQLHQTFRSTTQRIGDQKHQLVVVVVGLFLGQLFIFLKKKRKECWPRKVKK